MPVRLGLIACLVMLSVTSSPAAQVPSSPRVPLTGLMQVAAARSVEGRVWGVPFRLLDAQLELLRAFVWQLIAGSEPRE